MKYHKDHFLYKCLPETKNPEFLSPDVDSALGVEDVKSTYGAATARAADSAGDAPAQVAFRGGLVVGASTPHFGAVDLERAAASAEHEAKSAVPTAAEAPPKVYGLPEAALDPPDLETQMPVPPC